MMLPGREVAHFINRESPTGHSQVGKHQGHRRAALPRRPAWRRHSFAKNDVLQGFFGESERGNLSLVNLRA